MNSNIKQHFRKEEVPFVESCDDLVNEAIKQYRPILTKFLNPREIYILTTIVNSYDDLNIHAFGGHKNAEMKRAIIYPHYFVPDNEDFGIVAYQVIYPLKFSKLQHSKILGTLMGTGIERSVIGDILTDGETWQFLCTSDISDYLKISIDKIGKTKVSIKKIHFSDIVVPENEWEDKSITLSSFRIDNVIASSFNISRNDAKTLVNHKRVHLNWTLYDHPDNEISINDIISVRKYGRIKLKSQNGETKKGKNRALVSILRK